MNPNPYTLNANSTSNLLAIVLFGLARVGTNRGLKFKPLFVPTWARPWSTQEENYHNLLSSSLKVSSKYLCIDECFSIFKSLKSYQQDPELLEL